MHKYKDTLVDENLNKLVQAAYILVPNVPSNLAIQERYLSMEYKSEHGFGVCVLRDYLLKMIDQVIGTT